MPKKKKKKEIGIIERIRRFRHIIPEERKILDKLTRRMQVASQFIYWYPLFNHKRVTPDVKKEIKKIKKLIDKWEKVIEKKKLKEVT